MQVVPSRSRVQRSTHILHVVAERVAAGPFAAAPGGNARAVQVEFRLVEVFKGSVAQAVGAAHPVTLQQREDPTGWGAAPAGVWTRHAIVPGSAWVAFAESARDDLPALLNDPACTLVLHAEEALDDVRLAQAAEREGWPAVDALARARAEAPRLHHLAAEYLWARFGAASVGDPAVLDGFLALLLAPRLAYPARELLLSELGTALDGAPPSQRARLASALFRLLALPEASAHHDNLVAVHLPVALGLQGPRPASVGALFSAQPDARDVARRALAAYRGPRDTAALRAWLGAE